ncbi:MAG TPA: DUF4402 domain-containing protein [Sphingomicrobium sp.]|nr:DUF4402 domain-containing protein [Sphingomicrobium sp.]
MTGTVLLRRLLATTLVLCAPATELCAAATNATGSANVILPATVNKVKDMDFGALSVGAAAGTAVLDPNADTLSTTGGVTAIGGLWHCAEFVGAARSSSVVNIRIPNQPITLTRVGGTETMTVSNFTLQGQSKRELARAQSFTFRVGGRLNVAANQAEGIYVGTFNVTVQYP